jgi:hypothetical protein
MRHASLLARWRGIVQLARSNATGDLSALSAHQPLMRAVHGLVIFRLSLTLVTL